MNFAAASLLLIAAIDGTSGIDRYESVSEIPPHNMVTVEEVAAHVTPGEVYGVRVFSYSDYLDTDRVCSYDYCRDEYLYVVVHDIGESPISIVLRSRPAYRWRNIEVSEFVTEDGLRFSLSLSGERDVQGNREFDPFYHQVTGVLGSD